MAPVCCVQWPAWPRTALGVGDIISGNYQNKGAWYPGRIVKVLARKGYYNVKYDDGDRESNVPTARLALVQSAEEDAVMRAPGKDKGAGTKRKSTVGRQGQQQRPEEAAQGLKGRRVRRGERERVLCVWRERGMGVGMH